MLWYLKVNMLQQLIIPTFEEEGYYNLRLFDLVEDLHERSKISIIGVSVNWFAILKIIKISYFSLLSSRDSNLYKLNDCHMICS